MDRFKGIAKGGWHPEKDSGRSGGIRDSAGGIRDSVKGLLGKSDNDRPSSQYSEPYVRKNPTTFAPPPPTKRYAPGEGPSAPLALAKADMPSREEEDDNPPRRTGPFVADTSGKDISKYPKPPPRSVGGQPDSPATSAKPKPALPPRLPPRTADLPKSNGFLNQGSLNRLGQAGISVSGLGIGSTRNSKPVSSARDAISPVPPTPPRTGGTTWAEKQAALQTASSLRENPGTVSMKDIRSAAGTVKNFHERHGDQVSAGVKAANEANEKYGLADKTANLSLVAGSKPPPPPPPVKKPAGGPPPIPLGSKPKF